MVQCQHCGKPLPDAMASSPFCSKEHHQAYQSEFTRLALQRLLKGDDSQAAPSAARRASAVATAERVRIPLSPRLAPALPLGPDHIAPRRLPLTRPPAAARQAAVEAPPPVVLAPKATAPEPVEAAAPVEAPSFGSTLKAAGQSRVPVGVRLGALAVAIVALAWGAYRSLAGDSASRSKPAAGGTVRTVALGPGGWFTEEAPDRDGARHGARGKSRGTFSLYRPSLELTDYRLEFTGRIEETSLGWVARFTDPANYQGMKLTRQGGNLRLQRWVVSEGVESSRQEKTLASVGGGLRPYSVRMDVKADQFTLFVDGRPVDAWTESRLTRGGFGFLNEAGERGRIDSVQVFLLGR